MTDSTEPRFSAAEAPAAATNPAIARCCGAFEIVYNAERAKGRSSLFSTVEGGPAYLNAMPALSGYENILDFIACAAHGIALGAIDEKRGAKLLYAAQIALGAIRREPKEPKRPAA
jgi:hypothetical protein